MHIFISYASEQKDVARTIALALRNEGHGVFFDETSLPAGFNYVDRIRAAIARSDAFIFLMSSEALEPGRFTHTELALAEKRWPRAHGSVLPVVAGQVPKSSIPAYLGSVVLLQPQGNVAAEVANAVAGFVSEAKRLRLRWLAGIASLALILVLAGAGWFVAADHREQQHQAALAKQGVEIELSLALYQFFEARFIAEAGRLIDRGRKAGTIDEPFAQRLEALRDLLEKTLLGPPNEAEARDEVEKFLARYPADAWRPLAAPLLSYRMRDYAACAQNLDSQRIRGSALATSYPKLGAVEFFRGVCLLRRARELDDDAKTETLRRAIDQFRLAASSLAAEPVERYRNFATGSARLFIAIAHFYLKELPQALDNFRESAGLTTGDIKARALNGAGYINFLLGDFTTAELELLEALDVSPAFPYARSNYGFVLMAQNRLLEAEGAFRSIVVDEELKAQSFRDYIVGRVALAHLHELTSADIHATVSEYSALLKEAGLRDFANISPPQLRLIYIYLEIADKIYLDRRYYGMEIFAALFSAKAEQAVHLLGDQMGSDPRFQSVASRSEAMFKSLRKAINPYWFSSHPSGTPFSPIVTVAQGRKP
jgi:tetratricopeptide (TPR) repeat protein